METGWLSPTGAFFEVEPQGHFLFADKTCPHAHETIERRRELCPRKPKRCCDDCLLRRGWLKLIEGDVHWVGLTTPTQRQLDFIFDWCVANNIDYKRAVRFLKSNRTI